MRILGDRVMIKKLIGAEKRESGLEVAPDVDALPKAEIILISSSITQVDIGDIVHYMESRESGKCSYNDEDYFIVPLGTIVAVI